MKLTIKQKIGTVLLALISLALVFSSFGMMFMFQDTGGEFANLASVLPWIPWLGLVKFAFGAMLWVPSLRRVSVLVLTGYLGGAIMAGLTLGEGPWAGGLFLLVLWTAVELKDGDFLRITQ